MRIKTTLISNKDFAKKLLKIYSNEEFSLTQTFIDFVFMNHNSTIPEEIYNQAIVILFEEGNRISQKLGYLPPSEKKYQPT